MSDIPRVWWSGARLFKQSEFDGAVVRLMEMAHSHELPPDAVALVPQVSRDELREAIAAKFHGLDQIVVDGFTDAVLDVLAARGLVRPADPSGREGS